MIIKGDLRSNVTANTINNINIKKFNEKLFALHKAQNLTDIEMKTVLVEHLKVKQINGKNVTDYVNKLEKILRKKQIDKVNVKGNVTMQQMQDLKTINGHDIDEFFEEVKYIISKKFKLVDIIFLRLFPKHLRKQISLGM